MDRMPNNTNDGGNKATTEVTSELLIDFWFWIAAVLATMSIGFGMGMSANESSPVTFENSASPPTIGAPFGQHLALDMKNVDDAFLGSEDLLIKAILNVTDSLYLNLVSLNCFSSDSNSIACLGVLHEAQISIYLWPETGVVAIDLFLQSRLPLQAVDAVTAPFEVGDDVKSMWTLDYRGAANERHTPLARDILSPKLGAGKKELLKVRSMHHKIEIWEGLELDSRVTYEDAVKHNLQPGDPRWTNSQLARPLKSLYVDDAFVYSSDPEELFESELDTHPALFSHRNPKQIGIIGAGGDEGPTVREVLKHQVDSILLFQKDSMIVDIVRDSFPGAFDCSALVGRSKDCLADATVSWVQEEASQWFTDTRTIGTRHVAFDVVFANAENPLRAETLTSFVESVMESLTPDGILAVNLGAGPTILHPQAVCGHFAKHEALLRTLEALSDVATILVYDDDNSLDDSSAEVSPSAWMLVCKSMSCRHHFYASSPEAIDAKIEERTMVKKDRSPIFEYYDWPVHQRLTVSPKTFETVYCRREPVPFECAYRTLDFTRQIYDFDQDPALSAFEILLDDSETDGDQEQETRQTLIRATIDIPKGSYIMPSSSSQSLVLSKESVGKFLGDGKAALPNNLSRYNSSIWEGGDSIVLLIGAAAVIRSAASEAEANVGRWVPPHPRGIRPKYSPVYDNHAHSFNTFMVATRDIPKGTEVVKYP